MKTFDKVIKESKPTLVVFMHPGNQDAVEIKYLLKEVDAKFAGKANTARVDDTHGQLKMEYRLNEYPTYILFKEGQELMRESGKKTEAELEEMIQRAL
ncbi:MAG: thioredoxin family protein [Muribaculaceae bacterium]|nr:thioredoxin family protein [Muribaculaceae bacterium]